MKLDGADLPFDQPHARANYRIARTFQTPRIVGAASVLENVMIGGTVHGQATFTEAMLSLPRHRRDEKLLRAGGDAGAGRRSASNRWPTCAPTACSTASCASWRSPAR